MVKPVKEVRLRPHCPDVGVHPQELEQGSRAPLLHPDDDGLRKLLGPEAVGHGEVGAVARFRAPGAGRVPAQLRSVQDVLELVRESSVIIQRGGQEVSSSREAVKDTGEQQDHGEAQGHPALRLQVSRVETCRPTSHGWRSFSEGELADKGIMP